jgi:hypothetical protein
MANSKAALLNGRAQVTPHKALKRFHFVKFRMIQKHGWIDIGDEVDAGFGETRRIVSVRNDPVLVSRFRSSHPYQQQVP